MAKRKDYYGANNKKAKAGGEIFFGLLKVFGWIFLVIFTSLVQLAESLYKNYKNRKK